MHLRTRFRRLGEVDRHFFRNGLDGSGEGRGWCELCGFGEVDGVGARRRLRQDGVDALLAAWWLPSDNQRCDGRFKGKVEWFFDGRFPDGRSARRSRLRRRSLQLQWSVCHAFFSLDVRDAFVDQNGEWGPELKLWDARRRRAVE